MNKFFFFPGHWQNYMDDMFIVKGGVQRAEDSIDTENGREEESNVNK